MKKNLFLLLVLFVGLVCISCNGNIKQPEGIGVNPNPLVLVGNKVDCEIAGTFPVKAFGKKKYSHYHTCFEIRKWRSSG